MSEWLSVALPAIVTAVGGALLAVRQYQSSRNADRIAAKDADRQSFIAMLDRERGDSESLRSEIKELEGKVERLTDGFHALQREVSQRDLVAEAWDYYARDLEQQIIALGGARRPVPALLQIDRDRRAPTTTGLPARREQVNRTDK